MDFDKIYLGSVFAKRHVDFIKSRPLYMINLCNMSRKLLNQRRYSLLVPNNIQSF